MLFLKPKVPVIFKLETCGLEYRTEYIALHFIERDIVSQRVEIAIL